MVFNSVIFLFYLIIVFTLHWYLFNKTYFTQNLVLVVSSFVFYSFWDWRFLIPFVFTILIDFYVGIFIYKTDNKKIKKIFLITSVIINVGLLCFFKYINFFIDNFNGFCKLLDYKVNLPLLSILLPIGISFYTFHGLSYVFDIYNSKIKPERNIVNYALFVNFFPLLVAGPIERATHLLPQLKVKRNFEYSYAIKGMKQILWGLTKKIVIADNCAEYVNVIFENYTEYNGSTLLIGTILFSFQIYGDFSGYTDIALGVARLFGIELLKNFSYPYFSRNIVEFWHRWHISLSSWFRDYLYIPLGGSRHGTLIKYRNVLLIFIISGFWHGANFTFIFWGFLNALLYMISLKFNNKTDYNSRIVLTINNFLKMIFTFSLVNICWIFFRAEDFDQAIFIIKIIFSHSFFEFPHIFPIVLFLLISFFIIIEWEGRENDFAIEKELFESKRIINLFYYIIVFFIMFYYGKDFEFIYFQF